MSLRRRVQDSNGPPTAKKVGGPPDTAARPDVSDGEKRTVTKELPREMNYLAQQPAWILLAVGSGACAAINGVFAKLTTTASTANLAASLSILLGLASDNTYTNLALRGTFFALNVFFNILMWTLFTKALTRASSTTRVSIVNVSTHFFITALLGAVIFHEKLPALWWIGASLLITGNVVIGKREAEEKQSSSTQEREELLIGTESEVTEVSRV